MFLEGTVEVAGIISVGCAALDDVRRRIILNRFVIFTLLCGIYLYHALPWPMIALGFALVIGSLAGLWFLVMRGVFGGGDAKMIPATLLLVPLADTPRLIFFIGLCGGVIGVAFLAIQAAHGIAKSRPSPCDHGPANPWSLSDQVAAGVPYGVAIWGGLLATILVHS